MVRNLFRVVLYTCLFVFPAFTSAQMAEVAYTVPQAVPVFGSGIALLLGLALFASGWVWLKKHPAAYKNIAVGVMTLGMLATVTSGGWMVSNANAVIATTTYLLSENNSPVMVDNFPAMLENDLLGPATLKSIEVSGCSGIEQITGSCEVGLTLGEDGGSCSLDSVCATTGQCTTGVDPIDAISPWVICSMDQNEAWISANTDGTYNADLICQNLGYDRAGAYGGNCGSVCGYCEAGTSCSSPGNRTFDGNGLNPDAGYGLNISVTVTWLCVNDPS